MISNLAPVTTTDHRTPATAVDETTIPVPRSGQAYAIYREEVWDGRWGCLDASCD